MRLNILVLHGLGFPGCRKTSFDHAYCFKKYEGGHNYLYHDILHPVTDPLRRIRFHAVLIDTTALCVRYFRPRHLFEREREKWLYLAELDAVKVAFPQDDYDHSEILDEWLADYRCDIVYTVLPDHTSVLYPRMSRTGRFLPALTGYVDDDDVDLLAAYGRPFEERSWDVGYRARNLPAQYGSLGQTKRLIAERALASPALLHLRCSISIEPRDVLLGDSWLKFLGDCKFSLGSEGGSSLHDPQGKIRDRVENYLLQKPSAAFDEIRDACFPGLDGRHRFSAISPRLFETAMARSCQILVRAPYLGVLRAGEHYIPLNEALDDFAEAAEAMADSTSVGTMVEATYETLIAPQAFRYRTRAKNVLEVITQRVAEKKVKGTPTAEFLALAEEHRVETARLAPKWWRAFTRPAVARRALSRIAHSIREKL